VNFLLMPGPRLYLALTKLTSGLVLGLVYGMILGGLIDLIAWLRRRSVTQSK
jgi:hypothetical protein